MAYERNDDHPAAGYFTRERFETRMAVDSNTRDQLFANGETDSISVTPAGFMTYREDPRTRRGTGGQPWGIYVNMTSTDNPVLADNDFRKALFFGADRLAVAEGVFRTYKPAAYFIKTDSLVGNVVDGTLRSYRSTPQAQALVPENDGYLPELALEYFQKAYERNNNEKITINFTFFDNSDDMARTAEVLQENWMSLFGPDRLEVVLTGQPPGAAYDNMSAGTYDVSIGSMGQSTPNIWSSMRVWTSDYSGKLDQMKNPQLDEWVARSNTGDLLFASDDERMNALVQIETILLDEIPFIPIFQNTNWQVFQERVTLLNEEWAPGIGFVVDSVTPIALTGTR